jgi:hypothetical protein
MRSGFPSRTPWTHVLLTLALIAVGVRIAAPPGFMFAPQSGLSLVICTGHGPLRLGEPHPSGPKSAKDGGPCLFATTGAAPPAAPERLVKSGEIAPVRIAASVASDLVDTRNANAVPPPARAPPRE